MTATMPDRGSSSVSRLLRSAARQSYHPEVDLDAILTHHIQ